MLAFSIVWLLWCNMRLRHFVSEDTTKRLLLQVRHWNWEAVWIMSSDSWYVLISSPKADSCLALTASLRLCSCWLAFLHPACVLQRSFCWLLNRMFWTARLTAPQWQLKVSVCAHHYSCTGEMNWKWVLIYGLKKKLKYLNCGATFATIHIIIFSTPMQPWRCSMLVC